jgi:hypothetical protein
MREKYSSDRSNCGGDVKSQFSRGVVSRIYNVFGRAMISWDGVAVQSMFLSNFCTLSKMLASK